MPRTIDATIAWDICIAERGRRRPSWMRSHTRVVSRTGTCAGTAGFVGPWTVTR